MILPVLGGPTGVGKSEVACEVALRLQAHIISADSMAVYRGMDIGTAKPKDCMKIVKHHLVDVVDPGDYFDAKIFEELALDTIEKLRAEGIIPLVVGGSYLYLQALIYGLGEAPDPDWKIRNRLYRIAKERGSEYLYKKLRAIDPNYAGKIHPNDTRRIVRALEVFLTTFKPFSYFHNWDKPRFKVIGFFLNRNRESLFRRIEERVEAMIRGGLVEEVRSLVERGLEGFLTSSQAIGYKELIPYIKGQISLDEAKRNIVKNTKDYARRQIRWFKKQGWKEINLDLLPLDQVVDIIVSEIRRTL